MPLPWPFVQFAFNFFKELLRDVREVGTLGNVLTDESVGILVGPALLVPSATMPQMRTAVSSGSRGRPRPRERLSRPKGVTGWSEAEGPGGEQPTLGGIYT